MEALKLVLFTALGKKSLNASQIARLEAAFQVTYVPTLNPLDDRSFVHLCEHAQVVGLTRRACKDLHKGMIEQLPQLQGVAIYAAGYEWVDVDALRERDVQFRTLPDYSTQTVAEHTFGMILTLSRRLHLSDRVARGDLPKSISLRGMELCGKQLGIIGFGKIGKKVAGFAEAFGMNICFSDQKYIESSYRQLKLDDLLSSSDILVLTPSSKRPHQNLLELADLQRLKPTSLIINSARALLLDKQLVLNQLRSQAIAGYAVDDSVFSPEELVTLEAGRVLQSCHTAWYSNEAMERGTEAWIQNVLDLAKACQSRKKSNM